MLTDHSARIEAEVEALAAEKGWERLGIRFYREFDSCQGEIDV
jgi:hypothetical protein